MDSDEPSRFIVIGAVPEDVKELEFLIFLRDPVSGNEVYGKTTMTEDEFDVVETVVSRIREDIHMRESLEQ